MNTTIAWNLSAVCRVPWARKHNNIQKIPLRKICMNKILETFKEARSASSYELCLPYSIPLMLRQEKIWKFASVRRKFVTLWFGIV
jgi:hypothetical protein